MIRYLTLGEILDIHHQVTQRSGGSEGVRDLGGLESAIAQPRMTFGGEDLYPTIVDKASSLGFSIVQIFSQMHLLVILLCLLCFVVYS